MENADAATIPKKKYARMEAAARKCCSFLISLAFFLLLALGEAHSRKQIENEVIKHA